MEETLIMNKFPLPKNYDGLQWNTVIRPFRRQIPAYLRSDLPQLRHQYIKEKFKQIGKFNCPKLEYFNKMIKSKGKDQTKSVSKKDQKKYNKLKDQLQYALMTTDVESNIVEDLIEKARKFSLKSNRSLGQKKRLNEKYFPNTIELVFRNRKKEIMNSTAEFQTQSAAIKDKINKIKLMKFQE